MYFEEIKFSPNSTYLYIIPITRYSRVEFNFAVDTLRMSGYTAHGQYGH